MNAAARSRRLTLMTVHAHPDDETIGTGGTMARAIAEGHRVVLVTCTRGEMGEIVVPELDTPENHRRLGELRAAELEAAMTALGVTEWENLGYRDSDMMGRVANLDPRSFWQADPAEATRRLVWLVRRHRPDVLTTYNEFGGYGHPDHMRSHQVAVAAFEQAGDPTRWPEQLAPEHGRTGPAEADGGLAPWAPAKLYEQATSRTARERMARLMAERGLAGYWTRPNDATPEQLAEWQAFMERSTAPDEAITTRVDVGPYLEQRLEALRAHRTQIGPDFPFMALGLEGWRELGAQETFILRSARVPVSLPETDLFAGPV